MGSGKREQSPGDAVGAFRVVRLGPLVGETPYLGRDDDGLIVGSIADDGTVFVRARAAVGLGTEVHVFEFEGSTERLTIRTVRRDRARFGALLL